MEELVLQVVAVMVVVGVGGVEGWGARRTIRM